MLVVRDVSLSVARLFVKALHRHSTPPLGGMWASGAWVGARLVGVVIVGRPVSRVLQGRGDIEVTRCCTDGTRNACSKLYAAARGWARRRGVGLVTYTLQAEAGTSLRAVGARVEALVRGRRCWSTPARPRTDAGQRNHPKIRWRLLP